LERGAVGLNAYLKSLMEGGTRRKRMNLIHYRAGGNASTIAQANMYFFFFFAPGDTGKVLPVIFFLTLSGENQ
jgi:hypothetical protein